MDVRVDARAKRMIALLDRVQLEEKYIELYEENLLLKKHAKGQEEKMKRLATKLIKLSKDNHKKIDKPGVGGGGGGGSSQETTEDKMAELSDKLRALETQNANLKGKVSVLRQQVESRWKRHTPYDNVKSRTDSGISKRTLRSFSTEDVSAPKRKSASGQISPNPVRYGKSLLEEARRDNQQLEELVLSLKEEISLLRAECDGKDEENRLLVLTNEEKVLKLQERLQTHLTDTQRLSVEGDTERIRLQRELQVNQSLLEESKSHCSTLEMNLKTALSRNDSLSNEVTNLNEQLTQSLEQCRELGNKVKASGVQERSLAEFQDMVTDLKFEKDLLKQRNDRLTQSLLQSVSGEGSTTGSGREGEREREKRTHELETKVMTLNLEINKLMNKLANEKGVSERLDMELSEVKGHHLALQTKHNQLLQKLGCYGNEDHDFNLENISQALKQLKEKKESILRNSPPPLSPPPSLPPPIPPNIVIPSVINSNQELEDLRVAYSQVTNELNKTQQLLSLQSNIEKDYKKEIDILQTELTQLKEEYEGKIREKTQLIAIKNDRIKTLETKLKDLAYRRQKREQPHPLPHPPISSSHTDVPFSSTEVFHVQSDPSIRDATLPNVLVTKQPTPTQSNSPPTQISNPLTQISNLPTHISNPLAQISNLPTQISNLPTQISNPLTQISNPPTQISNLPTQISNPPTQISNPPTQISNLPTQISNPPTQLPQSPPQSPKAILSLTESGNTPPQISNPPTQLHVVQSPPQTSDKTQVPVPIVAAPPTTEVGVVSQEEVGVVTQDEMSVVSREDSIEEELTDVTNDTMFGDSTDEEILLPFSTHQTTPTPSPTKPSVILLPSSTGGNNGGEAEDDYYSLVLGDSLDLSEEEEEGEEEVRSKEVLPVQKASLILSTELNNIEVHFSLTIISFTIEEDSTISSDTSIKQLFVEYQFLDYDISELETPESVVKPDPGQPAMFNFCKDFHILPHTNTMKLLQEFILSPDPVININVVSDPEGETTGEEEECQELGTHMLNLIEVLQESGDSVILDEDVCTIPDNELIGFLTLKLDGLNSLRHFTQKLLQD